MELLERAQVLRDLSELLADAAKGDGGPVLVAGDCDHLDAPSPLGPLADIARAIGDHDFGRLLTERTGTDQIFARLLDLLTGRGRPFLVIIEDAKWADQSTLDLLRYLGRRITSTGALVLVTYRSDEHADDDPLRALVGDLATSAGVTSLTLDALTLAAAPAVLPRTVNDAIRARVSRLSAQARATVEAAAVIGYGVDHRVLSAVAVPAPPALDECITKGMLSWAEGCMTFRHELTRAAVLDGIPPRRAELHGRALVALASDPVGPEALAVLAHHAQKAGDRSAAHSYASAASAHAARLGAHREAAAQYKLALCSADDAGADLYEAYARECAVTGDIDAAVAAAETAIEIRTGPARLSGRRTTPACSRRWSGTRSSARKPSSGGAGRGGAGGTSGRARTGRGICHPCLAAPAGAKRPGRGDLGQARLGPRREAG